MNTPTNPLDDRAADWVAREDRSTLTRAERARRDAWLDADVRHRGAHVRAQAVWLRADRAGALGPGLAHPLAGGGKPRAWWLALAAAAAAAVAMLALFPVGPRSVDGTHYYETRLGEVLRVPLADGSVITLNSNTRLGFSQDRSHRSVDLQRGEALVDVAKDPDRPFTLRAGPAAVVAVGTSFSVRRREGGAFDVLVRDGIVDIRMPQAGAEPTRVKAQQVAVSRTGTDLRIEPLPNAKIEQRLGWREGVIVFEGSTLADAAAEFAQYSNVRILIDEPGVAGRRIVGVYSSTDPLGFARTVADSFGLQVEVVPEGVHLRSANLPHRTRQ